MFIITTITTTLKLLVRNVCFSVLAAEWHMYRKVLQGANLLLSWCKAARWCHTQKNHPGSHPMRPFFRLLYFSSKKRHHASISNSDSEKRGTIAFEIPTESFLQKMPPKKTIESDTETLLSILKIQPLVDQYWTQGVSGICTFSPKLRSWSIQDRMALRTWLTE